MTPAIIVIRHARDMKLTDEQREQGVKESDLWDRGEPHSYELPNGDTIEPIPWHRLSDEGKAQAQRLAAALPEWVEKQGLAAIGRVVTMDPRGFDTTQNPFETVYPFIQAAPSSLQVEQPESVDGIAVGDAGFSTLVCWDRQGMWGGKEYEWKDGQRVLNHQHPEEGTLLHALTDRDGEDWERVRHEPQKGRTIYLYKPKNGGYGLEVFYLHSNGEIDGND